jgi:uncharacterized protein (TIGR02186 family)
MKHLLTLALLLMPPLANAQLVPQPEAITLAGPMVADISQRDIQIHSGFTGTQLLIYGARNVRGDLVIAVRGPTANVTLRRKERNAGMWMHVEQHKYDQLPLFYATTTTRPLKDIAARYTLQQLGLGARQAILGSNSSSNDTFDKALRELLVSKRRWQEPFDRITYFGESLFSARLNVPDTLPGGTYSVEVYLFSDGKPIAFQTIPLRVYKTGFDAMIYREAQQRPWLYGFAAIAMALCGGWLGHRLFHRG